jgi:hypothetical protein
MTIQEIAREVQTQDNSWHITSYPIYLVERKVRDYGLDPAYCDEYVWLDDSGDCNELEPEEDAELIKKLDEWDDSIDGMPIEYRSYTKAYYRDRWEFVTLFFTEKGAREFMERNKHRYDEGEIRLYVDSAYRNEELKVIQGFLKELK